MPRSQGAVHRIILVVDVERFGSPTRADPDRLVVREGLYRALPRALRSCGVSWSRCHVEDRGDGILLLAPPQLPKAPFVTSLPGELAKAVRQENARHSEPGHMRLRVALHAGEVSYDEHGVSAACINVAFRLLDAPALKSALAGSPGVLALAASTWFFDEVIRHSAAASPASYRPVRVTVKETSTVAWIALPDFPYPADQKVLQNTPVPPDSGVPHQLPAHTPHFVGRASELATLTSLLDKPADPSQPAAGTLIISAIGGTAGIGKTTLALRWAHQIADQFPDGQLYVNLRGFDPAGSPIDPTEVIRSFLGALGVAPTAIPVSLEAQAALYRSLIAGRRFLLLLDNARDAEQVRPLLPGTETCLVLVTSRSQLTSLAAREGAQLLDLDSLTIAEARELLTRRLGPSRASREPGILDEVIERCARLPLALSIAAARATAAPTLPLAGLADELRDEQRRLDALDGGDLLTNVRAVFSCSYRQLSDSAARMFRMLSLHPGPDVSVQAAASLAGIPMMQARKAMGELTRAYLVTEANPSRFTFHDLLRSYAAQQGASIDTETERQAAVRRILDHYLHNGHAAIEWLYPGRADIGLIAPDPRITAEELTSRDQARAWCEAEHKVLPAIVTRALLSGFYIHAWQIPWVLTAYFNRQGYLHEWIAALLTALTAVRRREGDQRGQALASHELGYAYLRLGSYDKARVHLRHALDLNRELGDCEEQAHNHMELSDVEHHQGHPQEALSHARQSVEFYRAAGHRTGQARARTREGRCLTHLGEYQQALTCSLDATAIISELGALEDEYVTAEMLKTLGDTHHYLHNYPQAIDYYRQALRLNRQLGDHYMEADTLTRLGDSHEAVAELDAAQDARRQAVAILDDLHHPDAAQVLAQLSKPREATA